MGPVSAALGYIIGQLKNPATAGSATEALQVAIINLVGLVRTVVNAIDSLFQRQRAAWKAADADIQDAATALDILGTDSQQMWHHLLTVILPHSLDWTVGGLHRWADSKFLPWSWLQSPTWRRVQSEAHTAYTFWSTWHHVLGHFYGRQWPDLQRWKANTADPQLRQLWAINPQATSLEAAILDKAATYLHSQRGETDLSNLTAMIIAEAPKRWRTVEKAILAWLQTEIPSNG